MTTGKKIGVGVGVVVLIGLAIAAWIIFVPGPLDYVSGKTVALTQFDGKVSGTPADFTSTDPVERGKYLAQAADCEACHTEEHGTPFAGGRPFDTDFGTLYAPNITPDPETGIGSWTDAEFLKAMHEGIGKGGKRLYPAFPYAAYTYLTEEDVLAIRAYLATVPAVKQPSKEHTLRYPYNQRGLMAIWAGLYNPNERFQPVADKSAEWNRGAYLAEALGHCGDCHTPRTRCRLSTTARSFPAVSPKAGAPTTSAATRSRASAPGPLKTCTST